MKELNDAKNAVEEYVYDLRDKLSGIYEKYITEDVSFSFFLNMPLLIEKICQVNGRTVFT